MATLMCFGFACRSCRPASRMRLGSCEALFHRGALGTVRRTTMRGVPASWRYGGAPGCPAASVPAPPRGLLLLVVLVWSKWEVVTNGAVQEAEHKRPLRCFLRLLAPFPAPALLALPSFSTAALAPGPVGLSKVVALESPLVPLPLLWPRCCCG